MIKEENKLNKLQNEIENNFGNSYLPKKDSLVINNGFDVLEKERTVQFFSGKNWQDIVHHLHNDGYHYLEEYSVMDKDSLSYYLRAYLEYLIENLISTNPDEEFISFFIHTLYQVIYINKGSPFNVKQTIFLKELVKTIEKITKNNAQFEYVYDGILYDIELFLCEIDKHC